MAKKLEDILKGVKSSKVVPGSLGTDPGVDYAPKAPASQDFVKKHATEKHASRSGNKEDIFAATNIKPAIEDEKKEPRHGYKNIKAAEKVYEAAKCNMTEAGTMCEVHGKASCMESTKGKKLQEVITKKTPVGEIIKDFEKSDAPQFKGKSKEKRRQMAIAASYHREETEVEESLAFPMIGEDDESAEMAKSQLKALANKALHLMMQIPDSMMLEPWVQSKITIAKDYINTVHDYMVFGEHDDEDKDDKKSKKGKKLDKEQMDTPMMFPNMSVDVNTGRNV
jgi:hypothetical protein